MNLSYLDCVTERGGGPVFLVKTPSQPLGFGSLVFWDDDDVSSSYCFASLPRHLMGPIKVINGTEGHPISLLRSILHTGFGV